MTEAPERHNRRMVRMLLGVLSLPLVFFGVTLLGGALSPREHRATGSTVIDASDAQIWVALTDVSSFVEWRSGIEGVELLAGDGHRRWREREDGEQVTYEIVEEERPRRLVTRIAGDDLPWGGTWTYELDADASGTRVTIVEDGWVDNLVFRFFARFVFGYESTIDDYLEDLSAHAPTVEVPDDAEEVAPIDARAIDVEGHRGARGLAPENTLVAFRRALEIGVTTLEMDLALTADDVVVVHHDETLNVDMTRGPDERWIDALAAKPIRSLTREDLATYDVGRPRPGSSYAARFAEQEPHDGARIPSLVDVFAMAEELSGQTIRYNLELKRTPSAPERTADPETFARAALAVVDAAGVRERTTFQSFDLACIDALAAIDEGLTLSCLTSEDTELESFLGTHDLDAHDGDLLRLVAAAGCTLWSPRFADVDEARVDAAHALGLRVVPWTLNTADEIARAYDIGVDGIISDHPERVREVLEAHGAPLPDGFR